MDRKSVGAGASVKVAILGFGTVGTSAARILCEHPPQGVVLSCIFNRGIDRKRVPWIPSSVLWTENFDQVLASNADIVVELAGGLNPAGDWVRLSLAAGKSVVTANKKLIAEQGPRWKSWPGGMVASCFMAPRWQAVFPSSPQCSRGLPATASTAFTAF